MNFVKRHAHQVLSLYVMIVFVQSLFFKFTRSAETIYIFETKLDPWGASLGYPGLFAPGGIFSAYVVGSAELVASLLLLAGLLMPSRRWIQGAGALLGLGIISGALFFHLFTPLGIAVQDGMGNYDGGELFMLACGVWVSCAILVVLRRDVLLGLAGRRAGAASVS